MSEASFASLNPALLARKGGAKPAMRPQVAPLDPATLASAAEDQLEDLGWNDMGSEDETEAHNVKASMNGGAEVVQITANAANEDVIDAESPIVRRQQKDLSDRVLANAAMETVEKATKKSKRASKGKATGKRAAFTLRLDAERHLKLRLASTMRGISAQALVTEALDALLADIEELDALAERMSRN